jgi:peptidoglycan/LPS O-acetylase OafA/YrhL
VEVRVPRSNTRILELDGLRGVAILLVLYFHYFQSATLPTYLSTLGRLTWSGVDLFFVLSGFLVGGILIDARTSPNYFKTFYIRRVYRILPIYAVVVFLFWAVRPLASGGNNPSLSWLFDHSLPWYSYATLNQNFLMAVRRTIGPAWLGATWSLAIEEQFYLTLPSLIWFASKRRLPYVLGAIILAAPLLRALLRLNFAHGEFGTYVLMPCRADALMLGVAAALLVRNKDGWERLLKHKRFLYVIQAVLFCGMAWMAIKNPTAIGQPNIDPKQTIAESPGGGIFSWLPYVRTAISSLNYTWIALFYLCMLLIVLSHQGPLLEFDPAQSLAYENWNHSLWNLSFS